VPIAPISSTPCSTYASSPSDSSPRAAALAAPIVAIAHSATQTGDAFRYEP